MWLFSYLTANLKSFEKSHLDRWSLGSRVVEAGWIKVGMVSEVNARYLQRHLVGALDREI